MAGEIFNFQSLLNKLQFNRANLLTHINVLINADTLDESRSAEDYGWAQITSSYYPYYPYPIVGAQGTPGLAQATKDWVLALAQMYAVVRTYTMSRKGDNITYNVKAVRTNIAAISAPINWSELQSYISINIAPGVYLGQSMTVLRTWESMISDFSDRYDGTFYYCHSNTPVPACHASRGRR